MRSQQLIIVYLGLVAVAGCRTHPAITMLEQENRRLEDIIYRQQDTIEDYRRRLESCGDGCTGEFSGPGVGELPTVGLGVGGPPLIEWTEPVQAGPTLDVPTDAERLPESGDEAPRFVPVPQEPVTDEGRSSSLHSPADNSRVTKIILPEVFSWRYDSDKTNSDEGLTVVVQPRDAGDQVVGAAAPISVVVLDPAASGEAARVARWDFNANEVAGMYRKTSLGEGIELELPWPTGAPAHDRLHLFVRYTTTDGRKVEADRAITINTAAPGPRWEPGTINPAINRTATDGSDRESVPTARTPTRAPPRTASSEAPARPAWSPDRQ